MATHIHLLTLVPKGLTPSSDFHGYCTHTTHRHVGKSIQRNKNVKEWNLSTSSNCGEMDLNLALKTHLFSPNTREEKQAYLYRFKVSLGYNETISIIKKEKKEKAYYIFFNQICSYPSSRLPGYLPRFTFLLLEKFLHHERSLSLQHPERYHFLMGQYLKIWHRIGTH